jgi:hypothetical protein
LLKGLLRAKGMPAAMAEPHQILAMNLNMRHSLSGAAI